MPETPEPGNPPQRRLSAIMFTDIAGYSRLSQENEALALALLEEHRGIVRPILSRFGGREIEIIGDAFLVEFESAVESARCACEIQRSFHERNLRVEPGRRIHLRIGLHIGDVVHIGTRVHGDGVNIAARVQSLAEPGGICLSEDVARQVENKFDQKLVRLGRGELKNIRLPVDIYGVVMPWETNLTGWKRRASLVGSRRRTKRGAVLVLAAVLVAVFLILLFAPGGSESYSRTRIAVLPFSNISADSETEYFADGMTEEMITTLSTLSGLDVIARTSVMKYKKTTADIHEIAQALMVGTILEGSVRKYMDKARINVQLVDVSSQKPLWSWEYDRNLDDVFLVQSEIAQKVASMLSVHLHEREAGRLEKPRRGSAPAFDQYLLGNYFLNQRTGASLEKAMVYYREATRLDSTFALAYSGLADCYTLMTLGYGSRPRTETSHLALESAKKAIALDPDLAEARTALAYIRFRIEWDWEEAEREFLRAIELKPGYARVHETYGLFLALLGRSEEALTEINRAYMLDPQSASVSTGVGRFLQLGGRYDESVEQLKKTIATEPGYAEAHFALAMTYSSMDRLDLAEKEALVALDLSGGRQIIRTYVGMIYGRAGKTEEVKKVMEEIRTSSPGGVIPHYYHAMLQFALGNNDAALDLLEKAVEERDIFCVFLKMEPMFDMQGDPRYQRLLRRIGF
jgi:TolB-like protein/class 3 adenylate cyclase/Flp pilus assembly protein TadD